MIAETRGRKQKLTPDQKQEILRSKLSVKQLEAKYQVSHTIIYGVFRNRKIA